MKASWVPVPPGSDFTLANLPYGVFAPAGTPQAWRVGVAIGKHVLDLAGALGAEVFTAPSLNAFMAGGPSVWADTREQVTELLSEPRSARAVRAHLHPIADVRLRLPIEVADYADFYASEHHARNLGRLFRPDGPSLPANWKHLPVGYHGRAGTVIVSGTPVVRPTGQRRTAPDAAPSFGPSLRLDVEVEIGFVVGVPSALGTPVAVGDFAQHVFGVVLLNDWSARDIQSWEYVPLGPFLGKSFATSISPWVVPLSALDGARVSTPIQEPPPLPNLAESEPWGLDLRLQLELNGQIVSRPPYAQMYWSPAQMLAHMTSNGASLRTGDLFASGTVSGPDPGTSGSLIELTRAGTEPLTLPDGTSRSYLLDGDTVRITGAACSPDGARLGLGEVIGRIAPPIASVPPK
ncbi:fumarylacetoacetase [Pseudonocardia bannensis]|uniref:fumarylacetoacetase n=1 Tax=Pseudonocardia bannensis TaxID=630973 RepID=A0A848DCR8_9PSEU|nr:fumarylacetoacetase [Pseudonocardia bannensis]NMH90391.1 fumarylacetoacetase [Pseudonocardia bannensis]